MGYALADLCIYILTWNVATKYPKDIDLSNALSTNSTVCSSKINSHDSLYLPDIYVVGLQEVNTSPWMQVINTFRQEEWNLKLQEKLSEMGYVNVGSERMQGIVLNVWILPEHYIHIHNIESQYTKTGLGGFYGNKGAVSLRMSLYGTGVCFVVSHLAAHDEKLQERINDYNHIVNKHQYTTNNYRQIFDHDLVFWFGDLNFRLNGDDSSKWIQNQIADGKLMSLLASDQLFRVRLAGKAFGLLNEEVPTFPPTYKFVPNTNKYNSERRPAWCDRILYRVQPNYPDVELKLKQLTYISHPDYLISDHKPVSAQFRFTIFTDGEKTPSELYLITHGSAHEVRQYSALMLIFISFLLNFTIIPRYV